MVDMPYMAKSGVYLIRNKNNNKVYVGSSATIVTRWNMHRSQLRRGVHHTPYLQRSWELHGEGAFEFVIFMDRVPPEKLIAAENSAMALFAGATYNFAPAAGSKLGMKTGPFSEEHRRKIGDAQRGKEVSQETRAKISVAHKGKTLSPEHKAAFVGARLIHPIKDETRKKLSDSARNISQETRDKRSVSMLATITPERRAAMSESASNISEETRAKRSESVRLSWVKRKTKAAASLA
jgi:group I intron endonuclease